MLNEKRKYEEKAVIKDLAREYLIEIKELSQMQMLHKMYFNLYKKKPDREMNANQLFMRILYMQKYGKYIDDTNKFKKDKKNKFKWSVKFKNVFKKSKKKRSQILVWYLNVQGELQPPQLCPIYSSNMIVIQNRPYEVDPRSFWRMGKYTCQIIKGIDRRPVSNLDLEEIRKRGDATDADDLLIKAALQAVYQEKTKKPIDTKIIVIVGLIAAAVIGYMLFGG